MTPGKIRPGRYPVDDDLVRRLVAGQFPQWAGLAVERFPSGGTVNGMFRLGDGMVVRVPLGEGGAGDVPTEWEWLPRLAPRLPLAVPEVLGAGGRTAEGKRPCAVAPQPSPLSRSRWSWCARVRRTDADRGAEAVAFTGTSRPRLISSYASRKPAGSSAR